MRRRYTLAAYWMLACGISWLLWSPLWLPAFGVDGLPVVPFHHALGAVGPIAAAFLVSAAESGKAGPRDLWRRMGLWRGRLSWVWVALLGPTALVVLALVGRTVWSGEPFSFAGIGRSAEHPQFSLIGFAAYNLLTFGYGEEVGWRGFALPRLQARHSALVATVLLTMGWAIWHIPLFFYRPGYASMDAAGIAGWFLSLLTGAVLLSWLYNESRGSLLVVALFHASVDVAFTSNPPSQLVLNIMGLLITIWGASVLILAGPRYLSRSGKMISTPESGLSSELLLRSRKESSTDKVDRDSHGSS